MPPTTDPGKLLEEFDTATQATDGEDAELDAPEPVDRRKTITVNYRAGNGQVYRGACIYEVPFVGDDVRMAGLRAQMRGPVKMLDSDGEVLIEMISYLEVTLGKRRPEWMRNLYELPDPALLTAIYAEAREHQARFRDGGRDLRQRPPAGA